MSELLLSKIGPPRAGLRTPKRLRLVRPCTTSRGANGPKPPLECFRPSPQPTVTAKNGSSVTPPRSAVGGRAAASLEGKTSTSRPAPPEESPLAGASLAHLKPPLASQFGPPNAQTSTMDPRTSARKTERRATTLAQVVPPRSAIGPRHRQPAICMASTLLSVA